MTARLHHCLILFSYKEFNIAPLHHRCSASQWSSDPPSL